jgi:hypothetical protein
VTGYQRSERARTEHGVTNLGRRVIKINGYWVVSDEKFGAHPLTFAGAVELLSSPWARWQPGGDERLDQAVKVRLVQRGMVVLPTGRNWWAHDVELPEPLPEPDPAELEPVAEAS